MKNDWQTVPLSSVLIQDTNYITELEPRTYPKLSVKLYGRGAELDTPTNGATVKMKRHQLAQVGQVIVSEIWAKKGAIGIVPNNGEGALVTSHFFLFDILPAKLERRYFDWLLRGNYFAERLEAQAFGTTGYAATRPKQFLSLEIPLPPLPEQQRIVARIEELARRVEEARGLRKTAVEEADALLEIAVGKVFENQTPIEARLLGRLATKIGSGSTPTGGRASYPSSGIPFIRSQNVRMREFQMEGIAFIDEATHKSMKDLL